MKTYQRIQAGKDHGQPQPTRREIQQRGSAAKARKANQTPARSLKAPKDKHQPQTAATTKNKLQPQPPQGTETAQGKQAEAPQQQTGHQKTNANSSASIKGPWPTTATKRKRNRTEGVGPPKQERNKRTAKSTHAKSNQMLHGRKCILGAATDRMCNFSNSNFLGFFFLSFFFENSQGVGPPALRAAVVSSPGVRETSPPQP